MRERLNYLNQRFYTSIFFVLNIFYVVYSVFFFELLSENAEITDFFSQNSCLHSQGKGKQIVRA